jgi:two-component system sensor histidine kinase GlrK
MAVMKRYPSSFLQLVTLGHILVALPLLVVTVYVLITLDTLAVHYRAAVEDVSESTRLSGELSEDLLHMERSLRRFEVLQDQASINDYAHVRVEWRENVGAFSRLPHLPQNQIEELNAQMALEETAFTALRDQRNAETLRSVIDEIKLRSQKVRDHFRNLLKQEQAQFQIESDALRNRLFLAVVVAISIAVCCLWFSQRLLSRLIGHFERVVVRLGKGDLKQRIALDGPGDLRWLGRWLEWLRRRLLSLEEDRAQVLRHVSHELKTPLAAMHEGSSLLAEEIAGPLSAEQRRIVSILQSNARRLQDLIEGLLRLQQAGHAAERIGHELLPFDQLIEQVLETYRLIAGEQAIEFQVHVAKVEIIAGREALLTIVHNLLSNAVKFAPLGSCIHVELTSNAEQAIFDVSDQGPGVPASDVKQIFEPFFRSANARQVAGVGLGLAIAREFVLAHRGELQLLDSPQGGAHFRVLLPLRAPYLRTQVNG